VPCPSGFQVGLVYFVFYRQQSGLELVFGIESVGVRAVSTDANVFGVKNRFQEFVGVRDGAWVLEVRAADDLLCC